MKHRVTALMIAMAVVLLVGGAMVWRTVRAQSSLATVPFAEGISVNSFGGTGGATLWFRKADQTYVSLQFSVAQPYSLLTSVSTLTGLLSGGLNSLFATPRGPAGVGLQSQLGAAADLDNNGSIGAAVVSGTGVNIYQGTTGLSFHMQVFYEIGGDVNSVSFADFNGDGLPDLAVAYDGDGQPGGIAILLNKGDGTFAKPVTYASGTLATRFVVFDLNHDGNLDIASVAIGGTVSVLLGKGDGNFGAPTQYSIGTGSGSGSGQAIAAADVNGDGKPDLVVGGTTGILLGNGDGTFHPGSPLPPGASSTFIWAYAAGDLNNDGKMDLVYEDIQNQVIAPLFGNGDGTFRAGPTYAVSQLPDSIVLADYNNDGKLDIINGNGDARAFGPGDQSGNVEILLNNGDGTFQGASAYFTSPANPSQSSSVFSTVTALATAKFGGVFSGLLASGSDGGLTLFLGNGKGGFQAPQSLATQGGNAMAAADFNGDGIADAAVGQGTSNSVAILLGSASGLGAASMFPAGVYPTAIASGDFDGDGKLDLAVIGTATGSGALAFLKGNGDGTFQAPVTMPAGTTPTSMVAADINGDGKLDLIFADSGTNGNNGAIYVLINKGAGAFQAPVQVFSGLYPAFGIDDVNGDGRLDLVAAAEAGSGNSVVSWLQGNGNGTFQAPVAIATSDSNDNAVLVQDFNGDGHVDIVLAHSDSGESGGSTFLAGNGNGTFSSETSVLSSAEPTLLATTDLNGDGKPDLIIGGDTITVLLNNSVPTAKASVASAAPAISTSVAPGSLASAYGADLASKAAGSTSLPLPTIFGGTTVSILDAAGNVAAAPLLYVIPTQVNFEVPPGLATGPATVTISSGDGTKSAASVQIAAVAPGIFELNSSGLAAAYVTLYHANGTQTVEQVYTVSGNSVVASPVSLGSSTDQAYLFIFGTGIQAAGTSGVKVTIGGSALPVSYAGAQGGFVGLDQVNALLPQSLKGKGNVNINVTANGIAANAVNITIQ